MGPAIDAEDGCELLGLVPSTVSRVVRMRAPVVPWP
jgi:hypothetical protein